MKEAENSLDPQLWHACAGALVQTPPLNCKVFYFPQGHAEHAQAKLDFAARIPPLILCRVAAVEFLAETETDEVYTKIKLIPLTNSELDYDSDGVPDSNGSGNSERPASFAKTLTQSDANNGGGFSVPRYCAETIFPRLDYSADPPVQTVAAKDVHGQTWKFRHIYRGTPRRHLLTTGWSTFVNKKKLTAGDSIVFLRAENGDIRVGIRRAKRGIGGGRGLEASSAWSTSSGNCFGVGPYGDISVFSREEDKSLKNGCGNSNPRSNLIRKVKPESVMEAVSLAASGQPFEVFHYPRANAPEFCIKAEAVRAAMRIRWCSDMRFKMAFETEDSSRISWFMGTIDSVQFVDPINWPNSPWRLLQVTWDEPDLLPNVKHLSPWLVEVVSISNMPVIHLTPFSSPRKKLRLDFSFNYQFPIPMFSGNPLEPSSPLCRLSDNAPTGIQGARHAQFGISPSDLHVNNKMQLGLFPSDPQELDVHSRISNGNIGRQEKSKESLSSLLTLGNSTKSSEKSDIVKGHKFLLFGQPILTEQQVSRSCLTDLFSQNNSGQDSLDENRDNAKAFHGDSESSLGHKFSPGKSSTAEFSWQLDLNTGHCKVFVDSEDVGWTLDLSCLGAYEELYRLLANVFGMERSEMSSHVLYYDANGAMKHTGEEPFSDFTKTAKRLTILTNSGSKDIRRDWITGTRNGEHGLVRSNKTATGPLSIFA